MHQKAKTSQIITAQPYILYLRNISFSSVSGCIRAWCSLRAFPQSATTCTSTVLNLICT